MAKLNITQAANVYGIDRSAIQRRIKKGELSYELSDKGYKLIEFSELVRALGEPEKGKAVAAQLQNGVVQQPATLHNTPLLEKEISMLKRENEELRKDKEYLKEVLDKEQAERQKLYYLLEDRRELQPTAKTKSLSWLNVTLIGGGIVITGVLAFMAWVF